MTANLKCERCGHFGFFHRLDDSLNISPVDPQAKFRCLWRLPGQRLPGQPPPRCDCADYVDSAA